jgi:hypothetical protein
MAPATQALLLGKMFCIVAALFLWWKLRGDYRDRGRRPLRPEHRHDRAARREANWYPNRKEAETNLTRDQPKQ